MVTKLHFSKSEALRFGWKKTKEHVWFFVVVLLIVYTINAALQFVDGFQRENIFAVPSFFNVVIKAVVFFVQLITQIGLIRIALLVHDGKKPSFFNLFSEYRLLIRYLIGSLLYFVIVGIGFILLVVPGIIWMITFGFYNYFIIDKDLGVLEAFRKSEKITKGVKLNLLLFGLIALGIDLLGVLALFIGLFITIPLTMIAKVHIYRKLLAQLSS